MCVCLSVQLNEALCASSPDLASPCEYQSPLDSMNTLALPAKSPRRRSVGVRKTQKDSAEVTCSNISKLVTLKHYTQDKNEGIKRFSLLSTHHASRRASFSELKQTAGRTPSGCGRGRGSTCRTPSATRKSRWWQIKSGWRRRRDSWCGTDPSLYLCVPPPPISTWPWRLRWTRRR